METVSVVSIVAAAAGLLLHRWLGAHRPSGSSPTPTCGSCAACRMAGQRCGVDPATNEEQRR